MIKHIVMWKICKYGTDEDRKGVIEQVKKNTEALKEAIPQILGARIGANVLTGDVFHLCIDAYFASMEALQQYIDHPQHLAARAYLDRHAYEKAVFDYEIDGPEKYMDFD